MVYAFGQSMAACHRVLPQCPQAKCISVFLVELNYRLGRRPPNVLLNVRESSLRDVPQECSVNVGGERPFLNFLNVSQERPVEVPRTLVPDGPVYDISVTFARRSEFAG